MFTVTAGNVKVGVALGPGVSVTVGTRVLVAVSLGAGVIVRVGAGVIVWIGVLVSLVTTCVATVSVVGVAVCCGDDRPPRLQANAMKLMVTRMIRIFLMTLFYC